MTGFSETNANGDYWDSSTNTPDPFVQVYKSGALVFASHVVGNAAPDGEYLMTNASSGSLPVLFTEGESMGITVREADSGTETQYMDELTIADIINFIDNGDGAATFDEVAISTNSGYVQLEISGTILY